MTVVQDDVLRVTSRMTFLTGGGSIQNVMYFQYPDAATVGDVDALADCGEVMEIIYTHIISAIADVVEFVDYAVKNMTQDRLLGSAPWPTLTIGGSADDPSASQVAALVLVNTSTPRVQGRMYCPPFRETALTNGTWLSAVQTQLANLAAELLTIFTPSNMRLVYVIYNTEFNTRTVVAGSGFVAAARTQRRRSIGFGS